MELFTNQKIEISCFSIQGFGYLSVWSSVWVFDICIHINGSSKHASFIHGKEYLSFLETPQVIWNGKYASLYMSWCGVSWWFIHFQLSIYHTKFNIFFLTLFCLVLLPVYLQIKPSTSSSSHILFISSIDTITNSYQIICHSTPSHHPLPIYVDSLYVNFSKILEIIFQTI